jgi:hypothetical protein
MTGHTINTKFIHIDYKKSLMGINTITYDIKIKIKAG